VLNVSTPGSAYFPFKCNWCGKTGHKAQNCLDRLAGKPKAKQNGRGGGGGGGGGKSSAKSSNQGRFSSGNKQKKDLSHIKCYNCGEMGHYKNKCPKLKQESASNVEVALMVSCTNIKETEEIEFVAYTTKWEHLFETYSMYCKACKNTAESVHDKDIESLSVKLQSGMENETREQATPITKRSKYELTDDFFDEFSNDGSDSSEEYDSEDISGVVPTPLWWFDACKENSQSSMEECKEISSSCKEFSCKETANEKDLVNGHDHGQGNFEDQSGYGEDANGVDPTSACDRPGSNQAAWWDFPKDSDYLSYDRDDRSEDAGSDENHNNDVGRHQGDSNNGNDNSGNPPGYDASEEEGGNEDDEVSYSGHESMSEPNSDDENKSSLVDKTAQPSFMESLKNHLWAKRESNIICKVGGNNVPFYLGCRWDNICSATGRKSGKNGCHVGQDCRKNVMTILHKPTSSWKVHLSWLCSTNWSLTPGSSGKEDQILWQW
jgi:Zinc knuckle